MSTSRSPANGASYRVKSGEVVSVVGEHRTYPRTALLGYPSESDLAVLRVTRRRSECRLTHLLKVAAPDGGPAAHVSAGFAVAAVGLEQAGEQPVRAS